MLTFNTLLFNADGYDQNKIYVQLLIWKQTSAKPIFKSSPIKYSEFNVFAQI